MSRFGFRTPPIHVHPVAGPVLAPLGAETMLDLEVFSVAAPKVESMDALILGLVVGSRDPRQIGARRTRPRAP